MKPANSRGGRRLFAVIELSAVKALGFRPSLQVQVSDPYPKFKKSSSDFQGSVLSELPTLTTKRKYYKTSEGTPLGGMDAQGCEAPRVLLMFSLPRLLGVDQRKHKSTWPPPPLRDLLHTTTPGQWRVKERGLFGTYPGLSQDFKGGIGVQI